MYLCDARPSISLIKAMFFSVLFLLFFFLYSKGNGEESCVFLLSVGKCLSGNTCLMEVIVLVVIPWMLMS